MAKACNDNNPDAPQAKAGPRCPICGEAACHDYRPFCSKRCADVDLGRWLGGKYVIAADVGGEEEDSLPAEFTGAEEGQD